MEQTVALIFSDVSAAIPPVAIVSASR